MAKITLFQGNDGSVEIHESEAGTPVLYADPIDLDWDNAMSIAEALIEWAQAQKAG